ncbi:MAG TPA: xanthine dehydrogenase family protein molybdopterin-binding subunit [Ilumatobacter sp.]|nr:xanthine dehydrogenase family protein molybdopterin-binding subunit [Ilumatobacter sp.]
MGLIGTHVQRREDPALLRGEGRYVANLTTSDTAYAVYVTSPHAHADIISIDVSAAQIDGVLGVYTAANVGIETYPPPFGGMNDEMVRPMFARDRVRYVGEPIVAVVAVSLEIAVDAAELIDIEYEWRPAVVDAEAARDAGFALFPGISDPLAYRTSVGTEPDFTTCEVVVTQRMVNQRVAAAPMETRSGMAWWEGTRLVHYSASQAVHENKALLAKLYGLAAHDVRVVTPDVGGSFGAKFRTYPEEALLGWFARDLGRPVTWTETRSASMTGLAHARGQIQTVTIGGRRDGTIEKYSNHVVQDAGAYPLVALLPRMTQIMLTGVYTIDDAAFVGESVVTNTTPVGALRGAGRPEAASAIERAVDMFAADCDLDPVEVRRKNFIPTDAFPYLSASGALYDSGNYAAALDAALDALGYEQIRADQRKRRAGGAVVQIGVGIATYVEVTASTPAADLASLELRHDGTVQVIASGTPHGQGHATVWAMLVADALGVTLDAVDVVTADTDLVEHGVATGGSRSGQIIGSLVHTAAHQLAEQARQLAADLLEAAIEDVVLDRDVGRFHVVGAPAHGLGWGELAAASATPLTTRAANSFEGNTFPFGTHIAVVSVDTETGDVALDRVIAVDDAGPVLNASIFDGQIHGGLAGGIAQALMEEIRFDDDGNPQTTNFADYKAISAAELPTFELIRSETPSPNNPLGVKGIGESGTIGITVAVQNAVVDAVRHLGVRHIDLPLTGERVWRAIHGRRLHQ